MNPEELFRGESETIEYKASVAPKSEAYMKTVIAFANGRGGQLLFGVQDVSGEALGLGRKTVFKYMDAVANAIASKCEPRIHPHIYLYEIDRKPIIIVDVPPGAETPYWIQGEGIENGTYVRVGATTRKADRYRIEELILRGQHKFFDQEVTDTIIKEADAQKFCDDLFAYAQDKHTDSIDDERRVGIGQLLSWGLLHEADHHFYASNGYLLMSGSSPKFTDTGIQCAVYRGNRRGHTIVRSVYDGKVYENIDGAMQFISAHLMDRDDNDELYPRSRIADLPAGSIREILVNAVCHRSYQTPGKTQVAIFDDKIEIVSPGGLDCSLAVEDIVRGRSRTRNPAIASALRYAGIYEGWGNGIPRLLSDAAEHGLPEPVVRARAGDFLVRIGAAEEDEADEVPEETEMLVPAGSIVQIPTVALIEPSSSSVGLVEQQDSYEFVPFEAFRPAEQILPEETPAAARDTEQPNGQWQRDVELAEHVNSVLTGAIEQARSPESQKKKKQQGNNNNNSGSKRQQIDAQKDDAPAQQDKKTAAQKGGKQKQKGKQKQQANAQRPPAASDAPEQQEREKRQQQSAGTQAAANKPQPRRADEAAPAAEAAAQQKNDGTQNWQGGAQTNETGQKGGSKRGRRSRRGRKRPPQERAAELEAALDAEPEPTEQKKTSSKDDGLTPEQGRILGLLRNNSKMTQNALRDATSYTLAVVRRVLAELEDLNRLRREGGRRYGEWVVID